MGRIKWFLVSVIGGLVLAGCSGSTVEPNDVDSTSATIRAVASCDGSDCHYWFRYRIVGEPATERTTPRQGPVRSKVTNAEARATISGLRSGTQYEYQLCGYGDHVASTKPVCVGPDGDPRTGTWQRFVTDVDEDETADVEAGEIPDDGTTVPDDSDSSVPLADTQTEAQAIAALAAPAQSRVTRPHPCSPLQSRSERTSGVFGTPGTVRFWVCAQRNFSTNRMSVRTYSTQFPGSVPMHWAREEIRIYRIGASRPGWTGRCGTRGSIPRSSRQPFFGGYSIPRPGVVSCVASNVKLTSRNLYRIEGRLCYDVRDDGKGTHCLVANAYL